MAQDLGVAGKMHAEAAVSLYAHCHLLQGLVPTVGAEQPGHFRGGPGGEQQQQQQRQASVLNTGGLLLHTHGRPERQTASLPQPSAYLKQPWQRRM